MKAVLMANRAVLVVTVFVLTVAAGFFACATSNAASCDAVVQDLNTRLDPKVEVAELVDILRTLSATKNRELPSKFVTKKEAAKAGWKPGSPLWSVKGLKGKSIGGDRFGNYEKKLPNGKRAWREADLDYHGGRRGQKRIVFSKDGLRMITVDHYRTFHEVPQCQ
jgi:ribonuclease T1